MKRIIISVLLAGILLVSGNICAYATESINDEPIVIQEDTSNCIEVDITNKALENYLNGIENPIKKDLLEKYFYLPSEPASRVQSIKTLDPVSQAKIMSKYSYVELNNAVDKIEMGIPELIKQQEKAYKAQVKELEQTIAVSARAAGDYSYTLKGSMPAAGGDAAWIKSKVQWQVNSSNEVVYLAPSTTTGLTSYYKWQGNVYGSEYVSEGKGYVNKYREFIVNTQDQSNPYWTVWCSGVFGPGSVPLASNGGYTYTE